jgi:hypothetical protein
MIIFLYINFNYLDVLVSSDMLSMCNVIYIQLQIYEL